MHTQCIPEQLEFQGLGNRKIVTDFSGGRITSDAGGLLLREVEKGAGVLWRFADCFVDHRAPELVEHSVLELVSQRVYGIALGYEDINDHDELRRDALLATLVGKTDPTGAERARKQDRGFPLAGKSTLNRLELAPADTHSTHRYHKIVCRTDAVCGWQEIQSKHSRRVSGRPERLPAQALLRSGRVENPHQALQAHGFVARRQIAAHLLAK